MMPNELENSIRLAEQNEYLRTAEEDINHFLFALESTQEEVNTLQKIAMSLEGQQNVSPMTAKIATIAISSAYQKLGIEFNDRLSTESFSSRVAIETIGETIERVWEAIKKAISYIFERLTQLFQWAYEHITKSQEHHQHCVEKVKEANPQIVFKKTEKGYEVIKVTNRGSNPAQEDRHVHIYYHGPDPNPLLGETVNAVSVGTSIVNHNKAISKFLDESRYVLRDIRKSILGDSFEGGFKDTFAYIHNVVPKHMETHFGTSDSEIVRKLKIQPWFYFRQRIVVRSIKISDMDLIKIDTEEDNYYAARNAIHVTQRDLDQAEEMRKEAVQSLQEYVKAYEHDAAALIKITLSACDSVIHKNRSTANELWYVHHHNNLTAIRETLQYLVGFIAARLLNAVKQTTKFDHDVAHLFSVCYRMTQTA